MVTKLKIWEGKEKIDDRVIACTGDKIYKVNPKTDEAESSLYDLKSGNTSAANFTGIPFSYIKEINMEEGKNYIEILFGKESSEELTITDLQQKHEIFDYFKRAIPNAAFETDTYSKLRAGKKPLIAMVVITLLFIWTFYITHGVENGEQYDVLGGHYNSIAGIVLILASLGTVKVIVLFSCLIAVAFFSFIQKTKKPKVVSRITIKR